MNPSVDVSCWVSALKVHLESSKNFHSVGWLLILVPESRYSPSSPSTSLWTPQIQCSCFGAGESSPAGSPSLWGDGGDCFASLEKRDGIGASWHICTASGGGVGWAQRLCAKPHPAQQSCFIRPALIWCKLCWSPIVGPGRIFFRTLLIAVGEGIFCLPCIEAIVGCCWCGLNRFSFGRLGRV